METFSWNVSTLHELAYLYPGWRRVDLSRGRVVLTDEGMVLMRNVVEVTR